MQAARAEAVVRFLSDDLIGALSPGGAGFERDPTVREMLEHAAGPLAERFGDDPRSEEHTSELQSLMRQSYAVFWLKKNTDKRMQINSCTQRGMQTQMYDRTDELA